MKTCSLLPCLKPVFACLALLIGPFVQSAQAIDVDTELVVLVDAQTYSQPDFDLILEGVAQSFEQQSFIDAVAAGTHGKIAASLVLFNSNNGQTVGIPWMELSSSADLQGFADTVRNVSNPTPYGNVSYAGAITEGAAQIASSIYEGTVRQLTLIDDGTGFYAANPAATQTARDAALASSADVINAVIFDVQYQEATAENYYNNNVIGGANGSVAVIGSPQGGAKSAAVTAAIESAIVTQITTETLSNVPEPSALFLLALSGLSLLARRRQ